jgi:hypothetical protein
MESMTSRYSGVEEGGMAEGRGNWDVMKKNKRTEKRRSIRETLAFISFCFSCDFHIY